MQAVLVKVGIPLPGSDHPAAGKGQRSQQHLEELTSLVDGHIDLREGLAQAGRVPPIDPSNSLTRIGVGSTKLVRAFAGGHGWGGAVATADRRLCASCIC